MTPTDGTSALPQVESAPAMTPTWLANRTARRQTTGVGSCTLGQLRVRRFASNPLVNASSTELANINGPSVIVAPSWVRPAGRFYLYYASHDGRGIRLAVADAVSGPWRGAGRIVFSLDAAPVCIGHMASPDVHVLPSERSVRMFFHCPFNKTQLRPAGSWRGAGRRGQLTFAAVSHDGLSFRLETRAALAPFYLRAFDTRRGGNGDRADHGGNSSISNRNGLTHGLALLDVLQQGLLLRSLDAGHSFAELLPGQLGRMRHGFVMPTAGLASSSSAVNSSSTSSSAPFSSAVSAAASAASAASTFSFSTHLLFFTRVGDAPERILVASLRANESGEVTSWPPSHAVTLLEPSEEEAGGAPVLASRRGSASGRVRELRDPAVLVCCGRRVFLFWAYGGESGISGGELVCDPASPPAPDEML